MSTSKASRARRQGKLIPDRFEPRFWDAVDGRLSLKKKIRRRYKQLKLDSNAQSAQKDQLCQRAAFLSVQIETMECKAAEGGELDSGVYVQAVNALSGLLSKLGLESQAKERSLNLKSYLAATGA